MAVEYIKPEDLSTTFDEAKKFMSPLFQPFDEFERIARNRPHPGIDKSMPKVTDGTLAALIQEQPKRVVQQIPTGLVNADDDWLEVVAGFIFAHEIIPNSDNIAALIQKCWAVISKTLTYGSQPAFVQFLNRGEYFGTDFTLPYIKDVLYEPGKLSDRDSNVIFLRTWWTKTQLQALIDKHKGLKKSATDRGDTYEAGWDLGKLADLLDENTKQKDAQNMTPNERDKQLNNGFFEIVHAFQRGIGANFYSFAPALGTEPDDIVVRTKKNPDPRGLIPIHTMYANVDLSNPLGRGSVELSGGMQNLLDSEVQSYQYMRALLINPPLKIRGDVSGIKYAPAAQWDLGTDEAADVEPVELSTRSLEQFPQNYGLIKSQILNLNSSSDTSVSAEAGNPGFSKTDAGVHANEDRLGISDNYMRKQFEDWFQEVAETEVNLYFAERHGIQELQLDDDTAGKLRKINPGAVSQDNKIRVDYDTETPKLKFQVDASSSSMKDNQQQLEAATNVLELCMKYPQLDVKMGGPIDVAELADRVVAASGLEDPEKIVQKPEVDPQTGQPMQQQQPQGVSAEQVQQMIAEAMKAQRKSPTETLNYKDAPEDIKRQIEEQAGMQPSVGTSPVQQEMDIKAGTAQVSAIDAAHKHADIIAAQKVNASDAAVKVAALKHNENVHQADLATHIADAAITADQHNSDLSHQSNESALARDAAAKAKPTAGVTK